MRAGACIIDGCNGSVIVAHGWCEAHYRRWRKHGDPLGGRTKLGEPERFFRKAIAYDGNECLIWPFGRSGKGYAQIWMGGRYQSATRLICQEAHGEPPSDIHQAAHSCGRGDDACVTKRHLSWKTPVGNMADQIVHGTRIRGEAHKSAKLTNDQALEIKKSRPVPPSILAERYGVSTTLIYAIRKGRRWGWLTEGTAR